MVTEPPGSSPAVGDRIFPFLPVALGAYHVIAVADWFSQVRESNEGNSILVGAGTITIH